MGYFLLLLPPNCGWETRGDRIAIPLRFQGPIAAPFARQQLNDSAVPAAITRSFEVFAFLNCAEENSTDTLALTGFSPRPARSLSKRTQDNRKNLRSLTNPPFLEASRTHTEQSERSKQKRYKNPDGLRLLWERGIGWH